MLRIPFIAALVLLLFTCSRRMASSAGPQVSEAEMRLVNAFSHWHDVVFTEMYREAHDSLYNSRVLPTLRPKGSGPFPFTDPDKDIRDQLQEMVVHTLAQDLPLEDPLLQLREWVTVQDSPDGQLRLLSWNRLSGGTHHHMAAVAQFRTREGVTRAHSINPPAQPEADETQPAPDITFFDLFSLEGNPVSYLALGWGTYGGGHHHQAARILRIEGDSLVDCSNCFNNQAYLSVLAPRIDSIGLHFDPATRQLSHREFESNEDTGFMRSTGREVIWKWEDGRFNPTRRR